MKNEVKNGFMLKYSKRKEKINRVYTKYNIQTLLLIKIRFNKLKVASRFKMN